MADTVFVDTNIFLRHVLHDNPEMSPRATAFWEQVELRQLSVHTADTVIFETVFILQRTYKVPRQDIQNALLPLLALSNLTLPHKRRYHRVFDYYVHLNIAFADAYHAVLMEDTKLTTICSFDREFDRVPTIRRIEP
jgi:predicted nucleic acid-binding protein